MSYLRVGNMPSTYREALALLEGEEQRDLGNNTRLVRWEGGSIALFLYDTAVVVFRGDNSVILKTSGWQSKTTQKRINAALGDRGKVWSFKSKWYYYPWPISNDTRVPFREGMVINADGSLCAS